MKFLRRSTDEVIFVLAALFFLLATLLLLDEGVIFKLGRRHYPDLQTVAVMGKKHNDVRRRIITDITWFPSSKSDELYLGDNIFTGAGSEATINFNEGSEMVLAEETLIILEKSTEKTILNLKWGMLSGKVKKGQPLMVKIGDQTKVIKSDGAEIQVNRNRDGGFELAVQKGEVEVTGNKGEKAQKITTGQALRSNEKPLAQAQKVKYQIELLAPVQNSVLWKDLDSFVEFQWKKTLDSKNYVLAVAKDRDFKEIIFYKNLQDPVFKTGKLPAVGILYWKVIDLKNKQTSQTHRFSLFNGEPPYPLAPANNRALIFGLDYKRKGDVKPGEYPVWMQWSYKSTFDKFEVEIAKDGKFKEVLKNKESNSWQRRVDLAEGHYFWRVRVKDDRRPTAAWSPPSKLTVMRVLPAPKINDKVKELKLDKEKSGKAKPRHWLEKLWNLLIPRASAADGMPPAVNDGMELNWQKIQDASAYEIVIAKDKELREVLERKTIKSNTYLWTEKQPGVYYWQVRAVNGIGELQKPSEVGKILLTVSSPKIASEVLEITAPLKEQDEPQSVVLEWKPAFKTTHYLVETSDTKEFKRIKEYLVKDKTSLNVLTGKTLFWRVTPLDDKERPVGDKTARALVQINYKAPSLFGFIPQIVQGRYTVPLNLNHAANGVAFKTPAIEYDLKSFGLTFGQKQINPSNLQFHVIANSYSKFNLKFLIPSDLIAAGQIEIEGDEKKILFAQSFDPKKEDLKFDDSAKFALNSRNLSEVEFKDLTNQNEIRLCLRQRFANSKVSSCSPAYKLENIEGIWTALSLDSSSELRATINGDDVESKGTLTANGEEVKEFVAEFGDKASIEIQPVPPKTEYDEVFLDNEENVIVKGSGDSPFNLVQSKSDTKNWSVKLPSKQRAIYIGSQNGFVWKQEFTVDKSIPADFDRPQLLIGSKTSTYKNTVALQGKVTDGFQVSTEKGSVAQKQNLFDWNFQLGKKGTYTQQSVTYTDGDNKHVGSYKVFRSYPAEFVSRVTAFRPVNSDIWGVTELSASYWFEDILGSRNYYWSQQRWGVTAQSMINLTAGLLRVSTADLKYRFSPGVWNREDSFGFKAGYQSMNYRSVEGSFAGVGAFWTISSKGLFDKALNVVPALRKPKVLDIQAMYYPLLVGTRGRAGTNYDFRANGKLFLKPDFFVEVGVGARQFGLTISSTNYVDATLAFCTGGIGWVL